MPHIAPLMNTMIKLLHGDCLDRLKELESDSIHAIVTDPPYGLSFMGKRWDYDVPSVEIWAECLRVLKPGGHLLAFAGTRTQHRMAVRIEDAGFEIRDMIAWVYGSGFPKSLDVSKAIDKAAGAEREVVGQGVSGKTAIWQDGGMGDFNITAPATEADKQWEGWGTALKPALEPITLARKPLVGTVAANVLEHGTGGINVDGCRVGISAGYKCIGGALSANGRGEGVNYAGGGHDGSTKENTSGRWPANLIHDGSEEVVGLFPETHSTAAPNSYGKTYKKNTPNVYGKYNNIAFPISGNANDKGGSAARFFYCAKASKRDRDEGCEGIKERLTMRYGEKAQGPHPQQTPSKPVLQRNHHPTVKPTDLMRYLCRLVTPPDGIVLDPFMGSGSTGKAAKIEGLGFIGIEREAEYIEIARARIEAAKYEPPKPKQANLFSNE
jgi:DNA modification methylase